MRRVLLGGVIGGLPGMLIALVPLLLYQFDVISSDASQIGLFIGVIVGMLIAASNTGYLGRSMLGALAGFVVGLAGGVACVAATGAPGLWLFTTPAAMVDGGVLGAWWGERGPTSHPTAPQH